MDDHASIAADSFVLGAGPPPAAPVASAPGVVPPSHPRRRLAVALAAGSFLVAIGAFLAWRMLFASFPFPDEIAGSPRIESEFVDGMAEMIRSTANQQEGVELDVAVYGDPINPEFVMFAVENADEMLRSSPTFSAELSFVDLSGADVGCVPNPEGAACAWVQEERMVGLGGMGITPEHLRTIALALKAELD